MTDWKLQLPALEGTTQLQQPVRPVSFSKGAGVPPTALPNWSLATSLKMTLVKYIKTRLSAHYSYHSNLDLPCHVRNPCQNYEF
jgi:hypothetical protein